MILELAALAAIFAIGVGVGVRAARADHNIKDALANYTHQERKH